MAESTLGFTKQSVQCAGIPKLVMLLGSAAFTVSVDVSVVKTMTTRCDYTYCMTVPFDTGNRKI